MTTDPLITIGIIGQVVPVLSAIYCLTIGNWIMKVREIELINVKLESMIRSEHLINDIKWE